MRLIDARQINLERSAFADFAVDPDEAAALFHDAVDRGKTEAGSLPLFLGGEKGLEDARLRFLVHAGAGVADGEQDVMSRGDNGPRVRVGSVEFGVRSFDDRRPPPGIASRALTARFMMTCSIWLASARMAPRSGRCE